MCFLIHIAKLKEYYKARASENKPMVLKADRSRFRLLVNVLLSPGCALYWYES